MKVAVFSKIPLFPTTGGNRARILGLVHALNDIGCDVTFILIPSSQMKDYDRQEHIEEFGDDFVEVRIGRYLDAIRAGNILFHVVLGKIRSLLKMKQRKADNVDYLFPKFLASRVMRAADIAGYENVIVEYVHFSRLFLYMDPKVNKILDAHDSFASEFTARAEAEGLSRADIVVSIQNDERVLFENILRQYRPDAKTKVVAIGHFVSPVSPLDVAFTQGATFIGSDFFANQDAVTWFIDDILPKILAEEKDFVLNVIGSVGRRIPEHPAVRVWGRVADLRDGLGPAPILVNPIRCGTGLKIKLIDSFANGVPTVSTQKGVEGIDPQFLAGVIVVADNDAVGFARATLALYRDPDLRRRNGQSAFDAAVRIRELQNADLRAILKG